MSFFTELEAEGQKVETFLDNIVNGERKLQTVYGELSGPTIAASMAVFYDVVKTVSAATAAAGAAAAGNVPAAFTLSETTIGLVQQIVADAKTGGKQIAADLAALNIKL